MSQGGVSTPVVETPRRDGCPPPTAGVVAASRPAVWWRRRRGQRLTGTRARHSRRLAPLSISSAAPAPQQRCRTFPRAGALLLSRHAATACVLEKTTSLLCPPVCRCDEIKNPARLSLDSVRLFQETSWGVIQVARGFRRRSQSQQRCAPVLRARRALDERCSLLRAFDTFLLWLCCGWCTPRTSRFHFFEIKHGPRMARNQHPEISAENITCELAAHSPVPLNSPLSPAYPAGVRPACPHPSLLEHNAELPRDFLSFVVS